MKFKADLIDHQYRNKYIHAKGSGGNSSNGGINIDTSKYDDAVNIVNKLNDWFYFVEDDNTVHSKYGFIGDKEVAAYGVSDSEGEGGEGETGATGNCGCDLSNFYTKSEIDTMLSEFDPNIPDDLVLLSDWFYRDDDGNIHAKYNFIGDGAVSAYGTSSSEGGGGGSAIYVGNDLVNKLAATGGTSISVRNNTATFSSHTHSNLNVLSGITDVTVSRWNSAYNEKHTHDNKTILDGITETKVNNWDDTFTKLNKWFYEDEDGTLHTPLNFVGDKAISAYGDSQSEGGGGGSAIYVGNDLVNKLAATGGTLISVSNGTATFSSHTHSNLNVLSGITDVTVSRWNSAYNEKHTHENKSVLDGITDTKVSNWNDTYTNFNDWFYKDAQGIVHSKYNFVGDNSISAYGDSTAQTNGNAFITVNGNNINELVAGNNINITVSGTKATISSTASGGGSSSGGDGHTHNNKTVLDGITAADVSNWNNAATYTHYHNNQSILDSITSSDITNWRNAASNSHTHSNKTVLDNITTTDISNWNKVNDKVSKTGDTMTGALNFGITGNSIYQSSNDAHNGYGEELNNLVIKSWNGVSFTTSCNGSSDFMYEKTAVGIDCRRGNVFMNGLTAKKITLDNVNIYATGTTKNELQIDNNVHVAGSIIANGEICSYSTATNTISPLLYHVTKLDTDTNKATNQAPDMASYKLLYEDLSDKNQELVEKNEELENKIYIIKTKLAALQSDMSTTAIIGILKDISNNL